jgi:hypothetical protein
MLEQNLDFETEQNKVKAAELRMQQETDEKALKSAVPIKA